MEAVAAAAATAAEPAATIETMLPFELLLDILERLPLLALLESAAYVNRRWRAAVAALLSGTVDLSKADGLVSLHLARERNRHEQTTERIGRNLQRYGTQRNCINDSHVHLLLATAGLQLSRLSLASCTAISTANCLQAVAAAAPRLKSLTLDELSIQPLGMDALLEIDGLEELHMNNCQVESARCSSVWNRQRIQAVRRRWRRLHFWADEGSESTDAADSASAAAALGTRIVVDGAAPRPVPHASLFRSGTADSSAVETDTDEPHSRADLPGRLSSCRASKSAAAENVMARAVPEADRAGPVSGSVTDDADRPPCPQGASERLVASISAAAATPIANATAAAITASAATSVQESLPQESSSQLSRTESAASIEDQDENFTGLMPRLRVTDPRRQSSSSDSSMLSMLRLLSRRNNSGSRNSTEAHNDQNSTTEAASAGAAAAAAGEGAQGGAEVRSSANVPPCARNLRIFQALHTFRLDWNWAQFQALQTLGISHASTETVRQLTLLPHLRELELTDSLYLEAAAFAGLAQLRLLHLTNCTFMSSIYFPPRPDWEGLAVLLTPLKQLEDLKLHAVLLNMRAAAGVIDEALCQVLPGTCAGQLRRLSVAAEGISDKTLRMIAKHCGELQALSLEHTGDVTEDGVSAALRSCVRLTELHLPSCEGVTDATLAVLVEACPQLSVLNISRCRMVTNAGLALLTQLSRLQRLSIYGVHHAGTAAVLLHKMRRRGCQIFYRQLPLAGPAFLQLDWSEDEAEEGDPEAEASRPAEEGFRDCADCGQRVAVLDMVDHRSVCPCRQRGCVNCAAGCTWRGLGTELAAHMQRCPYYVMDCRVCGMEVQRFWYAQHLQEHELRNNTIERSQCPMRAEGCLEGLHLTRSQLAQHMLTCPYWEMICRGCGQSFPRHLYDAHRHHDVNTMDPEQVPFTAAPPSTSSVA